MTTDLVSKLKDFIRQEKIDMKLRTVSNSEFWLEGPLGFLTTRFHVDEANHEILYNLFSLKYDVHLKEADLQDVEKLDLIVEEKGKWDYEKSIEGLWLALDCIKLWAQTNRFSIKEKRLL